MALARSRPSTPDDGTVDELLVQVEPPEYLERRLRRIPWRERARQPWGILAAAASVLLLISAGGFVAWRGGDRATEPQRVADVRTPDVQSKQARRNRVDAQPVATSTRPRQQAPVTVRLGGSETAGARETVPLLDGVTTISSTIRRTIDAKLRAQTALGASGQIERLPDLDLLEPPVRARRDAAPSSRVRLAVSAQSGRTSAGFAGCRRGAAIEPGAL